MKTKTTSAERMEPVEFEEGGDTVRVGDLELVVGGGLRDVRETASTVLALIKGTDGATVLALYERTTGALRHRIDAPEGWSFGYLTNHPEGPSVVAWSPEPRNNQDWHFAIDLESGALRRTVPAR